MKAKDKALELGRNKFKGVLFTAGAFILGIWFAVTIFPVDQRIVTDEIFTQMTIYAPGFVAMLIILFAGLILQSAKDIDSEKEARLITVGAQLDTVTRRIEERQKFVNKLETAIVEKESSYEKLLHEWGRWRVEVIGYEWTPRDLLVSVHFVDLQDNKLAQQIRSFFADEGFGSPWKTDDDIEHIPFRRNPSDKARIVVFSKHDVAGGIRAALNDCRLISEKVDRYAAEPAMLSDVTIIVFPK